MQSTKSTLQETAARMLWFVLAAALLIFGPASLGLMGCAEQLATDAGSERADSDCQLTGCTQGYVCVSGGACLPPGLLESEEIALRVVPSAASPLPEQHFSPLPVEVIPGQSWRLADLIMTDAGELFGNVTQTSTDGIPQPVQSSLIFVLDDGIIPIVRTVDTNTDGNYSVLLLPGRYQLTVQPDDERIPPFHQEIELGSERHAQSIGLPAEYNQVTGQLVHMVPSSESEQPVAGARVRFVNQTTNAVSSTESISDAEGRFSLLVSDTQSELELRVGAGEPGSLVPNISAPDFLIDGETDLGVILLGEWEQPIDVEGSVAGVNGSEQPVEGASIFFEQRLELGVFRSLAQAAADGSYVAQILPGIYDVTLVPPSLVHYAAEVFEGQAIDDGASAQDWLLEPKPTLSGRVVDSQGMPVGNVLVSVEPTGFAVTSLSLTEAVTQTDSNGLFSIDVHPGTQRLALTPPTGAGLSPFTSEAVDVSGDLELQLVLDPARVITGRILDGALNPLTDATVEAFVLGEDGDWVRFNSVSVNSLGEYVLTLPAIN